MTKNYLFQKGQIAWNKGKPRTWESSGSFKKGHIPWNLGKKHSLETRKKISLAHKGKKEKPRSKEYRKKLSKSLKGKPKLWMRGDNNPMKKPELRKKVSLALKGRIFSEEWKNKISKRLMGKIHSEETKNKMRISRLKRILPTKDTSIEIKLQNWLKEQRIEFETHYPILGQPDIFIKPNICIFADGCYWHKCPKCGFGELRERDLRITQELQKQGYIVYRIWEHEIRNNQFEKIKI